MKNILFKNSIIDNTVFSINSYNSIFLSNCIKIIINPSSNFYSIFCYWNLKQVFFNEVKKNYKKLI